MARVPSQPVRQTARIAGRNTVHPPKITQKVQPPGGRKGRQSLIQGAEQALVDKGIAHPANGPKRVGIPDEEYQIGHIQLVDEHILRLDGELFRGSKKGRYEIASEHSDRKADVPDGAFAAKRKRFFQGMKWHQDSFLVVRCGMKFHPGGHADGKRVLLAEGILK